eukprot:191207_1
MRCCDQVDVGDGGCILNKVTHQRTMICGTGKGTWKSRDIKSSEVSDMTVQNLMDKVCVHLNLSFHAGYRLSQKEILRITIKPTEKTRIIVHSITHITSAKSELLYKIRGYRIEWNMI